MRLAERSAWLASREHTRGPRAPGTKYLGFVRRSPRARDLLTRERRLADSCLVAHATRFPSLRIGLFACAAWIVGCAPSSRLPTVASCSALPVFESDRATDAVALLLRLENKMSPTFEVVETCISIDERSARQDAPAALTAGFSARRSLEVRASLRPGVAHRVRVVVTFAGRGQLQGYRFSVASPRDIAVGDLRPGVLLAEFVERPGVPAEQRPTVKWTDLGAIAPAP